MRRACAGRLEPREVSGLVLVPLRHDDPPVRVVEVRPRELAALNAELELRQVRAGEMVREIGRRELKVAADQAQRLEHQRASRVFTHRPASGVPAPLQDSLTQRREINVLLEKLDYLLHSAVLGS